MSDAIERAAQVLNDEGACCGDCGREPGAPLSECPACERFLTGYARALADVGLLAPAPLREEWAQRWIRRSGEVRVMKVESREDADPGGEFGVEAVHRFVSDWLPADTDDDEGDGRAEK